MTFVTTVTSIIIHTAFYMIFGECLSELKLHEIV